MEVKNAFLGLHPGFSVQMTGVPLDQARAVMLMLHGRGASAEDILSISEAYNRPDFTYIAPQAEGHTWYPNRFNAPIETNEPWLSSALALIDDLVGKIVQSGIPLERIILLGFSQGACLTLEYAARNAKRYGGVVGYSGALIGPDEMQWTYPGSFAQTPIFLGCSDKDPHVSMVRVQQAAQVLRSLGGSVTERFYAGMGHTIHPDEISFVKSMMEGLVPAVE